MSAVLRERSDSVLTLTLNRPDRYNAFSAELVDELLDAVEAASRSSVDLLVLRGAGRGFSAGFDLNGLDQQSDGDLLQRFVRIEQLLQAVHHAPFATVALAHGSVYGAAADLVCACDHRIAAPGSRFRMPGLAFGIVLGTRRLAVRVGSDAARTIQSTRNVLGADDALQLGLLTAVVPSEDWSRAVTEIDESLAGPPPAAREIFHRALTPDHRERDLVELVRSAAIPGLAQRLSDYARSAGKQR